MRQKYIIKNATLVIETNDSASLKDYFVTITSPEVTLQYLWNEKYLINDQIGNIQRIDHLFDHLDQIEDLCSY